ncbi:YtpI family protein [Guptibacillus hwajinpoensis]|uniref:YtpI family protein n=1 Tax=Guptibacillus hwajinpoensis TaxID=208199 RepID=UPI00188449DF|nr:YtpI family protein [Pseudalkalibacillus hwajinpoensis]MBF0706257.1 YtpI family protein [Pseudalkalibacillus hwajinpoensis]WLR60816.1 YtpI family protein [Pseudalkalibacillus hwajinpoensis]
MPIFVILIVFSIVFYLFYRVKAVRHNGVATTQWLNSKASIALGLFLIFFAINTLTVSLSTVTVIVAAVFILLGLVNVTVGYKKYRHYLPFAIEEAKDMKLN